MSLFTWLVRPSAATMLSKRLVPASDSYVEALAAAVEARVAAIEALNAAAVGLVHVERSPFA
jgi:hypothetical protein